MRQCLTCRKLITKGSYCKIHNPKDKLYNNSRYRKQRAAIQRVYAGQVCPTCKVKVMNPPTADHVIPGDPNSPMRPQCLSCNSGKKGRIA